MDIIHHLFAQKAHLKQEALLSAPDIGQWWQAHIGNKGAEVELVDKAIKLAFYAPSFAYSFLAAYQYALKQNFPKYIGASDFACLCVSEKGGNSPKSIEASLSEKGGLVLNGYKSFVTGTSSINKLIVMVNDIREASIEAGKEKELKLLLLEDIQYHHDTKESGLQLIQTKPSGFIPEIDKGGLELNNFVVEENMILPGNAHEDYSKPFSILEGLYIRSCNLAFILKLALLFNWPNHVLSSLAQQIVSLMAIIQDEPGSSSSQIVLDGCAQALENTLTEMTPFVDQLPGEIKKQWERDKICLYMDFKLREKRFDKALKSYNIK